MISSNSVAYTGQTEDDNLKHVVIQEKPTPKVMKMMVENPADSMPVSRGLVTSGVSAKLVDYYFMVGNAQRPAIAVVPDSP